MSPSNNPRHLIESGIQEVLLPLIKEHFESYLRSHVGRMTGINYSGSFVVEDLLLEDMIGPNEDFGLLKAIVRIGSGTQEIPLIVKCFLQSQISGMAPLANAAQSVEGILAQDSFVKTLRLLHFSHADLSMFFEGIPFHLGSFAKSSLSHAQKYFLAGRALAPIHGHTLYQIDISRYLRREFTVIRQLPDFAKSNTGALKHLFKANERKVKVSYAGARSYGYFLPETIHIPRDESQSNAGLTPQVILLDPSELSSDSSIDRMEDVANFFSWVTLANLALEGSTLDREGIEDILSQSGFFNFMQGYNSHFKAGTSVGVSELYGEGHTLGYQLALRLLEMLPSQVKTLTEEQAINLIEGIKGLLQIHFAL